MSAVSEAAKAKHKADILRRSRTPLYQYKCQKRNAIDRSIPFLLTFEEWWGIWEDSGKYAERGKKPHQYCMSRNNDTGGYEIGNVYISQVSENIIEQMLNGKHLYFKIRSAELAEIKARVASGETQSAVSKDYGISRGQISRLVNGLRGKYSANIA